MTAKKTQETVTIVEQPENNDCFIIMPIADHPDYKQGHFKRVYDDIFAPACRAAGYRPIRADDVAQTNLIHLDILQKLLESPMAICDLSTRNPNVLFELGLRQAFDKPTVLVQEVGTPQIFDINLFRYTQYRNELDYRDVLADQKTIQKVLEETKLAVHENKSVNSIIKLLSIMEPAKLQDSSKFSDKDYFEILMGEINSLKREVVNSKHSAINSSHTENIDSDTYLYRITLSRILTKEEYDIVSSAVENIKSIELDTIRMNALGDVQSQLVIHLSISKDIVLTTGYFSRLIEELNIQDLEVLKIFKSRTLF